MSAGDSPPLPRRPATARPRSDAVEHEHVEAGAPTREELEAIERKHIELTTHAGAEVVDDASLGVAMVRLHGRGPGLNYAAQIRWASAEVGGANPGARSGDARGRGVAGHLGRRRA